MGEIQEEEPVSQPQDRLTLCFKPAAFGASLPAVVVSFEPEVVVSEAPSISCGLTCWKLPSVVEVSALSTRMRLGSAEEPGLRVVEPSMAGLGSDLGVEEGMVVVGTSEPRVEALDTAPRGVRAAAEDDVA